MDHIEAYKELKSHWKKRAKKIVKLREEGKTFAEIGYKFLISRQRAEQIFKQETGNDV